MASSINELFELFELLTSSILFILLTLPEMLQSLFFRAISHNLLLVVLWFDPDTLSAF
jgi:hypothetical protein